MCRWGGGGVLFSPFDPRRSDFAVSPGSDFSRCRGFFRSSSIRIKGQTTSRCLKYVHFQVLPDLHGLTLQARCEVDAAAAKAASEAFAEAGMTAKDRYADEDRLEPIRAVFDLIVLTVKSVKISACRLVRAYTERAPSLSLLSVYSNILQPPPPPTSPFIILLYR